MISSKKFFYFFVSKSERRSSRGPLSHIVVKAFDFNYYWNSKDANLNQTLSTKIQLSCNFVEQVFSCNFFYVVYCCDFSILSKFKINIFSNKIRITFALSNFGISSFGCNLINQSVYITITITHFYFYFRSIKMLSFLRLLIYQLLRVSNLRSF